MYEYVFVTVSYKRGARDSKRTIGMSYGKIVHLNVTWHCAETRRSSNTSVTYKTETKLRKSDSSRSRVFRWPSYPEKVNVWITKSINCQPASNRILWYVVVCRSTVRPVCRVYTFHLNVFRTIEFHMIIRNSKRLQHSNDGRIRSFYA